MGKKTAMEELKDIVKKLRSPQGCPWDRRQTAKSLIPCMIEEVYELKDGIDKEDVENTREELGDILFLLVSIAAIAEEEGDFTLEDVIVSAGKKMKFRHPKVFSEGQESAGSQSWEERKREEKEEKSLGESLRRIPASLPAAIRAQKVQKKVVASSEVALTMLMECLKNDVLSLENTLLTGEICKIEDIYGKMLFDAVGAACFLQLNAENSLTNVTNKFINRFVSAELKNCDEHGAPGELPIDEILNLWNE